MMNSSLMSNVYILLNAFCSSVTGSDWLTNSVGRGRNGMFPKIQYYDRATLATRNERRRPPGEERGARSSGIFNRRTIAGIQNDR